VAFAVLCLALLTLRPQTLREGGPAPLGETHARLRAAEEETRIVRVLEADPGGAGDLRARAERAVRALSEVLAIVPAARAAEAWDERARWARSQIADGARAGADLAGLTARRPLRVAYLDARVAAASRGGRIDAAIAACGEAIDRGVRPGDFHRNRAALVLGTGAAGPAVERDLAAASGFGQRRPMVLVLLGDLLLRRGETGAAGEAYARAADRDPDLPEAWGGLGEARHAQGDLEGALRSYARARALAPRDPWVLNNEGVVLRDAGRREEALERFREAHALAPELFEPAFNAGLALERLGRAAEAHGWFRRARQARPGFPPVEEALRRTTPVAGEGSDD
jgi:tetratricopeptide (TPR) repeat protein